ncbi:MAG: hypothetical protein GY765_21135, partial [bacterium]|nr:hypothetical protein [bacterium]
IRVRGGKIFIKDRHGMVIFDLNGEFINRYKVFSRVISFDVWNDRIYSIESGNDKLLKVCDLNGKKLSSFGKKYDYDFSLYKGHDKTFIDGCINKGKVLCSEEFIVFFSGHFGEVRRYDYSGKLLGKSSVEELDPDFTKMIGSNKKLFFEKGVQDGANVSTVALFRDVYSSNGKIYFLSLAKPIYDEVLVVTPDALNVLERYRLYWEADSKKIEFWGMRMILKKINNLRKFYISMLDKADRSVVIKLYQQEDS